jgi:hypothetical protein
LGSTVDTFNEVILAGVADCLALVAEMPHEKLKKREARSVANVRRANDTLIFLAPWFVR